MTTCARRLISRITDPLGRTTTYAYDARLRLVKATARDGGTTTYEWDGRTAWSALPTRSASRPGQRVRWRAARGAADPGRRQHLPLRLHAVQRHRDPHRGDGPARRRAPVDFDANGNVVANQQAANGNILERNEHRFTYDAASGKLGAQRGLPRPRHAVCLRRQRQPGQAQVAAFSYGDRVTEATYDPVWNVPTRLKLPNGGEWTYQYDGRGNLVRVRARWRRMDPGLRQPGRARVPPIRSATPPPTAIAAPTSPA